METYETKLTKENLTMTKWKVSPEQGTALINAAIDLGHSPKVEGGLDNNIRQLFFYESGTFAAVCTIEDHEGYEKCTDHKEMKFDDWFGKVEIKEQEKKVESTEKIVDLSKPVVLKTINDIQNSYVEINATRQVSDVIANIKHEAKKHYVKFNEAHQSAGDLGESMAHAAVCHWIEHFFVMKEEKKESLSDKEWSGICFHKNNDPGYTREAVRQTVEKLKKRLPITFRDSNRSAESEIKIHDIIDEEFGEKLT